MRRALVVFLTLCVIAWLEFAYFPGHSYIRSTSQVYVAALEHLQTPGFLSRDLAATHPNFGFTAYDEVTLFLSRISHQNIQHVLTVEQLLARAAGLFGLFLLARTLGLRIWHAVAISAVVSIGTYLPGPQIWLFDAEPTPRSVAIGFFLLSVGLLARGQVLLAGLIAGCALLLDPVLAAPLWIALLIAFTSDRMLRPRLRSLAPMLLVFVLLLANLAQLQQGTPDSQLTFDALPPAVVKIIEYRSPELWISLWSSKWIYSYLALLIVFLWALTRIWPAINRQMRWLLTLLGTFSVLSLPASAILVDRLHSAAVLSSALINDLTILALLTWILCAAAAMRAHYQRRWKEMTCWLLPALLLFLPAAATPYREPATPTVTDLAAWARNATWGSSVFLFPEAGKSNLGGRFRAESLRALWVDWAGGAQITHDPALASEWFRRWRTTMKQPLTGEHLQTMLDLPIDYFVINRGHAIEARTAEETRTLEPAFRDDHFAVYEASVLRIVPGTLLVDGH